MEVAVTYCFQFKLATHLTVSFSLADLEISTEVTIMHGNIIFICQHQSTSCHDDDVIMVKCPSYYSNWILALAQFNTRLFVAACLALTLQ